MKGARGLEPARAAMRRNPEHRRDMAAEVADGLAAGGKTRGIRDDMDTVPEKRHNALLDLADFGDLLEDDVVQMMDAVRASAYAHWPAVPSDWAADWTAGLSASKARQPALPPLLAGELELGLAMGRRIASARPDAAVSAGLVYLDWKEARVLPGVARAIVSVGNASGGGNAAPLPGAGARAQPGTVALIVDADIYSEAYRDLTEQVDWDRFTQPALVVAARHRSERAGVIYALAGWRAKLRYVNARVGARRRPSDAPVSAYLDAPVSAYLIVEGMCAHRVIAQWPEGCRRRPPGVVGI